MSTLPLNAYFSVSFTGWRAAVVLFWLKDPLFYKTSPKSAEKSKLGLKHGFYMPNFAVLHVPFAREFWELRQVAWSRPVQGLYRETL